VTWAILIEPLTFFLLFFNKIIALTLIDILRSYHLEADFLPARPLYFPSNNYKATFLAHCVIFLLQGSRLTPLMRSALP
jgi:hypothetical protein